MKTSWKIKKVFPVEGTIIQVLMIISYLLFTGALSISRDTEGGA